MFLISDLCKLLETYMEDNQVQEVYKAYLFGAEAHEGQKRLSGEPYIYHPLAVARILAELKMDYKSIMAAILHDVIEDTPTAKEQLAQMFDEEVAELVDGVSKLTQIKFSSKAEAQAENFRKLILAMVQDIRVILIKLADRLHNMRTLEVMRPDKQRRIAKETLDIYVPIANRLGINAMRVELEDLGFRASHPLRYKILQEAVKKSRGNRSEIIQKIEAAVSNRLSQENLAGQVVGREKFLYSIYRKMQAKRLSFSEVYDVYAFRIIVKQVDDCYRTLGIVHNLYKPLPGKFKDYIAIPKANGYQSLHTVLFGPYGVPIEVQIRTEDMEKIAEAGIASHWLYKTDKSAGPGNQSSTNSWLRELLEIQKTSGNSQEFLENVKIDLYPDVVYVFTPRGEIMDLPRGATAVDFAYTVHTDIGNTCIAAKIDRQLAPLRTPLQTGQTVEIITSPNTTPNPAWLNFVITGKARTHIRHYLKNLQQDQALAMGKRLLEQSLNKFSTSIEELDEERINQALSTLKLEDFNSLLVEIGLGNRMALLIAHQLATSQPISKPNPFQRMTKGRPAYIMGMFSRYAPNWLTGSRQQPTPIVIKGTEGTVVTYAKCCRPIPGDPIVGTFNPGRGLVVHIESCRNIRDYRKHPENWVELQWEKQTSGEFPVEIRVSVSNQKGVLATVAAAIAQMEANIENVSLDDRDGHYPDLTFLMNVHHRQHLARIIRRIRAIDEVTKISRSKS